MNGASGNKYQVHASVVRNAALTREIGIIRLECSEIAGEAYPGQFVMIRVRDSFDPLLRRPFSINAVHDSKYLDIVYRVVGKGTGILSSAQESESLDIVGPLGHGFELQKSGQAILLGGGMGVAPLHFLAQKISQLGRKGLLLLGARSKKEVFCVDQFERLGFEVMVATEDGSLGVKGIITDLITPELVDEKSAGYACGPYAMLRAVAQLAREKNLPCQVSLESSMACGIGACLGCVAKMNDGSFLRVCVEGPVFDAGRVQWK